MHIFLYLSCYRVGSRAVQQGTTKIKRNSSAAKHIAKCSRAVTSVLVASNKMTKLGKLDPNKAPPVPEHLKAAIGDIEECVASCLQQHPSELQHSVNLSLFSSFINIDTAVTA